MLKTPALSISAAWLALAAVVCTGQANPAPATASSSARPASSSAALASSSKDGSRWPLADRTFDDPDVSPIGLDYAPEARCSDNNPSWMPGARPIACQPQLGEKGCRDNLDTCPARCQQCYDDDLGFIRSQLKVKTITIYAPNYYILKAAHRLGMKVIVGLYNDSVLGLAMPAGRTNCTYGGAPLYLCGSDYASAVLDGACIDKSGGNPFAQCSNRCSLRADPARDCVKGDCSCNSDADCKGPANRCLSGSYIPPLSSPLTGDFLRDGTVIGIQLGNEFFGDCQIPKVEGQNQKCCAHNRKTNQCRAWTVDRRVFSAAAQTLRQALQRRGLGKVKITVSLVEEQGPRFCRDGAPPPGIDYVAAHPYCDFQANVPPYWSTSSGAQCWEAARKEFAVDQKACGAQHTYIGETGYNTGCPSMMDARAQLKAGNDFVRTMVRSQAACDGIAGSPAPFPDFLFEFGDTCPAGGCISGCGDPLQCNPDCCCKHQCTSEKICSPGCPECLGNGYFGLYHTPGYTTVGFPPVAKFNPTPSLLCPTSGQVKDGSPR